MVGKSESEPVERQEVVWFTENVHVGILKTLAKVWKKLGKSKIGQRLMYEFLSDFIWGRKDD